MQPIRDSFKDHISDDLLEAYAVGRASEADVACLEEHMLVCEPCRSRLVAMESFVSLLRGALEAEERRSARVRTASSGGTQS
jgi:anti-sigma factor RsiW